MTKMIYEVRPWFDKDGCLYTDDVRVKDLAILSADLRVTSTYFRTVKSERQPFAWDIVGSRPALTGIASRFSRAARG
jgi:hypothetical protein